MVGNGGCGDGGEEAGWGHTAVDAAGRSSPMASAGAVGRTPEENDDAADITRFATGEARDCKDERQAANMAEIERTLIGHHQPRGYTDGQQ